MSNEFPRVDDADLPKWREVWDGNQPLPLPRRPGLTGKLVALFRRLLRPLVTMVQADLWERQRIYNQLIQHHLEARYDLAESVAKAQDSLWAALEQQQTSLEEVNDKRESDTKAVYQELLSYSDAQQKRIHRVEDIQNQGLDHIREHHDAAFAIIDHKLDKYRRRAEEHHEATLGHHDAIYSLMDHKLERYRSADRRLQSELANLLKVAEAASSQSGTRANLVRTLDEQAYLELERRHRGTEQEIAERVEPYLPFLAKAHKQHAEAEEGAGIILDLGCGRGEALEVFQQRDWTGLGVDSNAQMIEQCKKKGLDAVVGDLFEVLVSTPAGSLTGVVSFHVIEHLPNDALQQLINLSWKALKPGGVLVVETPSPLSVIVGARNFWLDPTHQRPVHPQSLKLAFELAGFGDVERIDRQPFADEQRLPQVETTELSGELLDMAHQVNLLRDQLDNLLYGFQDFGMVGCKPRLE